MTILHKAFEKCTALLLCIIQLRKKARFHSDLGLFHIMFKNLKRKEGEERRGGEEGCSQTLYYAISFTVVVLLCFFRKIIAFWYFFLAKFD